MDSSSRVNIPLEVNSEDMQVLQDSFCNANDIYIMCVSKKFGQITSFSGKKSEEDFVEQFFNPQIQKEILDAFLDGEAENIVAYPGEKDYLMYRGVAIRGEGGALIGAWLCFTLNEELLPEDTFISPDIKRTTEEKFDKTLKLLEILTKYYFVEKIKSAELLQGLIEERDSSRDMETRLMKNEIMTEILRMMESDNSFTKISEDIMQEAGQYIAATHVCLLQLSPSDSKVDMITEWCRGDSKPMMPRSQGMDKLSLPFMNGKPYTVSSDSVLPDSFAKYFKENGIDAGIFLPIEVNEKLSMYLCFLSINCTRKWSVEDLRFANDIKRIIHTILIKRITKNSLASSYAALEAILQNTGCGVAVSDVRHRSVLFTNDTFKKMFENEIDRLAVDEILFDSSDSIKDITGYAANGSGKWYNVSYSSITWVDGQIVRLSTFYDVSELKSYQKKMEKQANEDMLTGLYNRQKCEKDIEAEFHFATKTEKEFAVLMIDLDDFGNINEGLGHANGDALLKFIAHAIDGISIITDKCYRIGGDEFAVIVDHEIYDKLDLIIKRICNLFDNPWVIDENEFYCTMSMGAVRAPKGISNSEDILRQLNIALHDAKDKGKNCFRFYDEQKNVATERLEMEHAMRAAVDDGCEQFEVYYQPLIELLEDDNVCCGAEALVRWNSPELGFVMPEKFIDLAEYLGLIIPIGEHVLLEACRRCKHWNDFGHPEYKVNVNISIVQFLQSDIVETVREALEKTAIDPHNLTLEVTETLPVEDMDQIIKVLDKLKAMGCRVALDDFGTGYSSLNYLDEMPIDTIKIDKSFMQSLGKEKYPGAFIKSVSGLASDIGMDVCCEGIETEEQLSIVRKYSVNVIQGWYFDKPMPLTEFESKYLI